MTGIGLIPVIFYSIPLLGVAEGPAFLQEHCHVKRIVCYLVFYEKILPSKAFFALFRFTKLISIKCL